MAIITQPISDVWPMVEKLFAAACTKQHLPEIDTLGRIRELCEKNLAFLFTNEEDASCAVVQMADATTLFIWAAWGENRQRERNMGFLDEIARNAGATRLKMISSRKGFARTGWEVADVITVQGQTRIVYTREVRG